MPVPESSASGRFRHVASEISDLRGFIYVYVVDCIFSFPPKHLFSILNAEITNDYNEFNAAVILKKGFLSRLSFAIKILM